MHAGEALWYLYAFQVHLSRKASTNPNYAKHCGTALEALKVLSAQVQVPLPTDQQLEPHLQQFNPPPPPVPAGLPPMPPPSKVKPAPDPKAQKKGGRSDRLNDGASLTRARELIAQVRATAEDLPERAEEWKETFLQKVQDIEEGLGKYQSVFQWQMEYLEDLPGKIDRWMR